MVVIVCVSSKCNCSFFFRSLRPPKPVCSTSERSTVTNRYIATFFLYNTSYLKQFNYITFIWNFLFALKHTGAGWTFEDLIKSSISFSSWNLLFPFATSMLAITMTCSFLIHWKPLAAISEGAHTWPPHELGWHESAVSSQFLPVLFAGHAQL